MSKRKVFVSHAAGGKDLSVQGVMHDFEQALINSVGKWFKYEHHLGCFFHWKQAIRHNLIEWGFKKESVKLLLPMFDFLTVIDKKDIQNGVEYLRQKVLKTKGIKRCDKRLFEEFLDTYFIKTWLKKRLIDMFNYNSGEDDDWR